MKLTDVIQNENWKRDNSIWKNKTTYFCKNRGIERVKWIKYVEVICSVCGELMLQKKGNEKRYNRRYCSNDCRRMAIKKYYTDRQHMSYVNGKYKDSHGYILVKNADHHRANSRGYVREHVLVIEESIDRNLELYEVVHHIDENKDNNDISNLEVMADSGHRRYHAIKNKLGHKDN